MSQESEDLADVLDLDPYPITIRGKTYQIPQLDWPTQYLLQDTMDGKKTVLSGKRTSALYERILGPVWAEMLADGVPPAGMIRAGEVALTFAQLGREMAQLVEKHGISPEALAAKKAANPQTDTPANRATRRASTRSRSTAAAPRTQKPASGRGTSSPKGTKPAAARKPPTAT